MSYKKRRQVHGQSRVVLRALFVAVAFVVCCSLISPYSALAASRQNSIKSNETEIPAVAGDFTSSAQLRLPDNASFVEGGIYRVTLQPLIQLNTLRNDEADFGVFNAEGKSVPFSVRARDVKQSQQVWPVTTLYPIWGKEQSSAQEELILTFKVGQDAKLEPQVFDPGAFAKQRLVLRGYVFSIPDELLVMDSMRFRWTTGKDANVFFRIETSDDLQNWQIITDKAGLVRFEGQDGPLESATVKLGKAYFKRYVRLLFEKGYEPAAVTEVELVSHSTYAEYESFGPINSTLQPAIAATNKSPSTPARLIFSLPGEHTGNGSLLVHSIQLYEPKPGTYCKVQVYTREHPESNWKYNGDATFYSVVKNGTYVTNEPVKLGERQVNQIAFSAVDEGTELPESLSLMFTYTPFEVYFLAQGSAPYSMHWHGNKGVLADGGALFSDIGSREEVTLAELDNLQLAGTILPANSEGWLEKSGWKNYLLWAMLSIGVLVLGYMAYQLNKSMAKGKGD